jgi:hypothetical protein
MGISFSLSLTATQAPLINAIKNYLGSYFIDDAHLKSSQDNLEIISQIVYIYTRDKRGEGDKPQITISIKRIKYLVEKIIPMLSNLRFVTKKYQDFLD